MAGNGSDREVVALQPSRLASPSRLAPDAAFLSALIAERDGLAPQRHLSRAPVGVALGAYDTGSRIAIRRLQPGYLKSVDA